MITTRLLSSAVLAAITLSVIPAAAHANEFWSNPSWIVGDYTDEEGPSCSLFTKDLGGQGRSDLFTSIVLNKDEAFIVLTNDDWTIKSNQTYSGLETVFVDQSNNITARYLGADWTGVSSNTLSVKTQNDLLDHYAKDREMVVTMGNEGDDNGTVVIARTNLSGSSLGVSKLKECHTIATARFEAEQSREQTNPKNPFK